VFLSWTNGVKTPGAGNSRPAAFAWRPSRTQQSMATPRYSAQAAAAGSAVLPCSSALVLAESGEVTAVQLRPPTAMALAGHRMAL
jgi:hypothetical protein